MTRVFVNEVVLMPGDVLIIDTLHRVVDVGNIRCSDDGVIVYNDAVLHEITYTKAAAVHDDGGVVFEKCAEFTGAWRS